MKIEFSGRVSEGDPYRMDSEGQIGAVYVGGKDVPYILHNAEFAGPVRVILNSPMHQLQISGELETQVGYYDEDGPVQEDKIRVGDEDIISELLAMRMLSVTLEVIGRKADD